jgi:hypothetical protein
MMVAPNREVGARDHLTGRANQGRFARRLHGWIYAVPEYDLSRQPFHAITRSLRVTAPQ